jgi:hypothetical protein
MKNYFIFFTIFTLVATINNNIPIPKVMRNLSIPQIKTVPNKHRFAMKFDEMNY